MADSNNNSNNSAIIEKLLLAGVEEQRKSRRWGTVFKGLTFVYLFVVLIAVLPQSQQLLRPAAPFSDHPRHTALIDIQGAIMADEAASADAIVGGLRAAFEDENTEAILLRINSPGGSPVQAGYIYDEIVRLKTEHPDIKLYAVIMELGASAAYYIAAAADEIYADKASLVGSIGVTGAGFGFVEAIDKLGIERRNFTAGEHKSFLDPFQPLKQDEQAFWGDVMATIHNQFIDAVERGRGDRLTVAADQRQQQLYSGLIWPGEQALTLGLVDGLGSAGHVARDVIGEEKIVDFSPRPSPLEQFSRMLGASAAEGLMNYLLNSQQRALSAPMM